MARRRTRNSGILIMPSFERSRSICVLPMAVLVLALLQLAAITMADKIGVARQNHTSRFGVRVIPSLFVFGDSTADAGNNNKLYTIARSNYPPFGRSFDTRHATGRFSDGRMTNDYIGEFLRLPLVRPYLSPEADTALFEGANFASAGAGVLNKTGDVLGVKISHWEQVEKFLERRKVLVQYIGEWATKDFLRHSLYYVAIGGNDFIHNYLTNDTDAANLSPDAFTDLVLSTLREQLHVLFKAGARKIVVVGIGPVGCAPHFLFTQNSTSGECLREVNRLIFGFNTRMAIMIRDFNRDNHGSYFIYRDIYHVVEHMSKHPQDYGFTVGNTACCGSGTYGGGDRCLTPAMVCDRPGDYVWWDEYHPSHKANHFIASQLWQGTDPAINVPTSSPADGSSENLSFMTVQELVAVDLGNESS